MPPARRSTGGARPRAGPTKGQSTISFSSRVTKSVPKEAKKAAASPNIAGIAEPEKAASAKETADDVQVGEPGADDQAEPEPPQVVPEKTEADLEAETISDAQIDRYWKAVQGQRRAPTVHQEDLDVSEKVLRYFDVSSQYGPCIGISRIKRWQRAERLDLKPPIEVLAVLRREEKEAGGIETAEMDNILNSTAAGAGA